MVEQPYHHHRCEVVPGANHEVSFRIDGIERTRWHFGEQYPRPFFYPFITPKGVPVTRMGHPGAPNHDHHQSVWYAHAKVLGIDFWGNQSTARIRQRDWLAYEDGDDEARMAVRLDWHDGHEPKPLLEQELIAVIRPAPEGFVLELQSTFKPMAETLEFGQTNFGFLAVRVAKPISAFFGEGQLTDSEGRVGEKEIFGKAAKWVAYARKDGPGVVYFDHPSNPGYPNRWHVREDGWMGASVCMEKAITITRDRPLMLRHLLLIADIVDGRLHETFAASKGYTVERSQTKHTYAEIRRKE